MKIAVIDMGTNTFHLMLTEVEMDSFEILHKERVAVKIGEKGINEGQITKEASKRALSALKDFKQIIDSMDVAYVYATATSAVRNASNGQALVDAILKQTNIEVKIISGIREAELILIGVRSALALGSEKSLIMDIGGGSIEFIIADQSKTYWLQSFEIGGQRLIDKFHQSDPISNAEINDLANYFDTELVDLVNAVNTFNPKTLVGCSGTFDTLSDIYCEIHKLIKEDSATEHPLPIDSFYEIYEDLRQKSRAERLEIPGMIEMRVDMIVVACVLVNHLLKSLQIEDLRVSGYALKEGVLMDTLKAVRSTIDLKK